MITWRIKQLAYPKYFPKTLKIEMEIDEINFHAKNESNLLVRYCQWVHVEKRGRRVVGVEKHNLNAGNLRDYSDITILAMGRMD